MGEVKKGGKHRKKEIPHGVVIPAPRKPGDNRVPKHAKKKEEGK